MVNGLRWNAGGKGLDNSAVNQFAATLEQVGGIFHELPALQIQVVAFVDGFAAGGLHRVAARLPFLGEKVAGLLAALGRVQDRRRCTDHDTDKEPCDPIAGLILGTFHLVTHWLGHVLLRSFIFILRYSEAMAQDQDAEVNPSHDLDLVTLFSSSNIDAEMEANNIHSMLEANGIPSVVVGATSIPSLEFQVQVPRAALEEAQHILEEARAAGPEAAAEAEAASEGQES